MVDSHQDRGHNVVILTSLFTSLSLITTAIRLLTRKLNNHLGLDDLAIAAAVGITLISWPFTILAVKNGYGRHVSTLSESQTSEVLKWLFVIEFNLFFTLPLTKMSICFFIMRIKSDGWLKKALYAMIFGLIITNLPALIVLCAQCQPLRAYWDRTKGTCWSPHVYNIVIWIGVSFGIFTDLVCSCLPVIVLWNIKIKPQSKMFISGLMSLGLLATACGGVRAYVSAENNDSKDLTYALAIITEWAVLEQHFAILGTNLALSRYVYRYYSGSAQKRTLPSLGMPTSNRRRYMTITKDSKKTENESSHNLRSMDPAIIKATTEIDVRSSFHSGNRQGNSNDYNTFAMSGPPEREDDILLKTLA